MRLDRDDGKTQRWWTAHNDTVVATVNEPVVLIETRLTLSAGSQASGLHYIVALTLDGKPYDWRLRTAAVDSNTRLDGQIVSSKDRIELRLPPGSHAIGVSLVASEGRWLLVRVRQAETRER